MEGKRPRKRQRADSDSTTTDDDIDRLFKRSISPPVRSKRMPHAASPLTREFTAPTSSNTIPSPVQLNRIPALPAASNIDTLTLKDLLGDPLISECWLFNYLFDVDFIMFVLRLFILDCFDLDSTSLFLCSSTYGYLTTETIGANSTKTCVTLSKSGLCTVRGNMKMAIESALRRQ